MINIFEKLTGQFDTIDFPFYNNNPRIPMSGWFVLGISLILGFFVFVILSDYSEFVASIIFFLIMFVPLLYYSGWDYSILLRKPTFDEVTLAVIMFLAYIIYAILMIFILDSIGASGSGGVIEESVGFETFFSLIFSMMDEELLKFIPLMFFMRVFYKLSNERFVSFVFSSIIVLVGFGLLHYADGVTIVSVLLIQGLGSVFELYGYYKTKNLFVPYLSHILTDAYLFGLMLLPF